MGWRRGYGGNYGGWVGPWPGRSPFSYLPSWYRPWSLFGRGRGAGMCRWFFNPYMWGTYGSPYAGFGTHPPLIMPYDSWPRSYYPYYLR